jgi:hypothetical protein
MAVNNLVLQVIEVDDLLWNQVNGNADVLVVVKRATWVEIFQVDAHGLGVQSGDETVEREFGGGEIRRLASFVSRVVDTIAASSLLHAFGIGFLGPIGTDDANVGGLFVFGHLWFVDEK